MLTLYDYLPSGNGYKVRLLMRFLGIPYKYEQIDILKGESRSPDFLARNPNGKIPTLELADGRHLPESNAILSYLADGTAFLPDDAFERAQVLRWMFFEQYSHEPYIAVARFWRTIVEMTPQMEQALPEKIEKGYAALDVMEQHLTNRNWFVGDTATIADIALYAYTHLAHAGGFNLDRYPAIIGWLKRIRSIPGYVSIEAG